ncbi:anti-sigma factor [Aeromicrobium sp. Root472D3]|uniref:anti-sigma factor n=1 Tax=Aeromicrobium sp. Root472D3 TaxID=1736540 RepID=UPI0006F9E067|nr:anti-sigma factor [Aeromicrobium sp. Root472D3]KQX72391.1 hypothetical protein ASD10_15460 [Aeromicrobium sp. Root472D3]
MTSADHSIDLGGLLRGELTNAAVVRASEHLDDCAPCLEELADLAVGHSLLTSASRRLGPAVPDPAPLPPLPTDLSRRRRPRRRVLLAVAAALVVGVAAGVATIGSDAGPDAGGAPIATARLEPFAGSATGVVLMAHDTASTTRMTIEADRLPVVDGGRFYYAWLLDPTTNKMLPLGQIGVGDASTFTLPDDLVASYSAVDISLQEDNGDPAHSVTSVLRASYDSGSI